MILSACAKNNITNIIICFIILLFVFLERINRQSLTIYQKYAPQGI